MIASIQTEQQPTNTILKLIADDKNSVAYRPSFSRLTGSATAAILLQQIVYWWSQQGGKPFFKFKEPCEHKMYKPGDSWCEELAMSRSEFDYAIDRICTKVSKSNTSEAALSYQLPRREDFPEDLLGYGAAMVEAVKHMVICWRDRDAKTWYQINAKLFTEIIEILYDATEAKVEILLYLGKARNRRYLGKVENSRYPLTETTQETTTENTNTYLSQPSSKVTTDPSLKSDSVAVFSEALEPKEKDSGEKEKVTTSPPAPPKRELASSPDGFQNYYFSGNGRRTLHLCPDGENTCLCGIPIITLKKLVYSNDGLDYYDYPSHQCSSCGDAFLKRQKSNVPTLPTNASAPSYVAPVGTRWIYPLDGIYCHLVRDANQPTVTLCGITPLQSYGGIPVPANPQVQCSDCLKATKKKPKADKPKQERTPRPEDPLFDAIAEHLFYAKDKASQHAVAGRVAPIMYGDKRSGRCKGLIAYEKERKGIEVLDYGALAKDVERFWTWFKASHADLDLKDCAKVMEWWVKFRASTGIPISDDGDDDPEATRLFMEKRKQWNQSSA